MKGILKERVNRIIREAGRTHGYLEQHVCVNGDIIPFGTETCIVDLESRIGDAVTRRDMLPLRTDGRIHYNGILKVLRRELNAAKRKHGDLASGCI